MPKKYYFVFVGFVILAIFVLFSYKIKHGALKAYDFDFTVKVQDRISDRFIDEFEFVSALSEPLFSSIIVLALTGFVFFKSKKTHKRIFSFSILFFFALLVFFEIFGKSFVHHPSPPFFMIKNPTTNIFSKYYINEQYSYPSGHAARTVFIFIILSSIIYRISKLDKFHKSGIIFFFFVISFLICLSRIFLGHHFFSDVVAGVMLAMGCGFLTLPFIL